MRFGLLLLFLAQSALANAPAAGGDLADDTLVPTAPPDEMLKIRDPFKRPDIAIVKTAIRSDLEKFPADQYKMIGVLTGPKRLRAMLKSPDGKTFFVAEKTRIGIRAGLITRISSDRIVVQEKIVNVLGQEEKVETIIGLQEENTKRSTE